LRVEALHSRLLQYEGEMASLLETVKDMQAQVSISMKQFPTLQRLDVFFPFARIRT